MHWDEFEGWFQWRSAQEETARRFPEVGCFVEVGTYLGRSLCSLGEVVERSPSWSMRSGQQQHIKRPQTPRKDKLFAVRRQIEQ